MAVNNRTTIIKSEDFWKIVGNRQVVIGLKLRPGARLDPAFTKQTVFLCCQLRGVDLTGVELVNVDFINSDFTTDKIAGFVPIGVGVINARVMVYRDPKQKEGSGRYEEFYSGYSPAFEIVPPAIFDQSS